jgi:hypothetical protein
MATGAVHACKAPSGSGAALKGLGRWTLTERSVFLLILAVAAALRTACVIAIPSVIESDYHAYWTIAQNIAAGRGLTDEFGKETAFFNLGYPLFLAGPIWIFGPTVAVVKALNVLLSVFSTALIYYATRQLFGSRGAAAGAAVLFAVYPESIVYTTYIAKENLMMFLMLAQVALAVTRGAGVWHYLQPVLFGMATGAVAIVGNAAVVLLPALTVQVYFTQGGLARAARYLMIAGITTILVIAPLSLRNHALFGTYALNTGGGINLYLGNNERSTPYFLPAEESPMAADWQRLHAELGEGGMDSYLAGVAKRYIEGHPGATFKLALRKGLAFWEPPVHGGKYQEGLLARAIRVVWLIEFCVIGIFFLAATLRGGGTWPRAFLFLWLLIGSYTAEHMVFYVIYRYRLPIMPVLCMGAGVMVVMIAAWADRRLCLRERFLFRETTLSPGDTVSPSL